MKFEDFVRMVKMVEDTDAELREKFDFFDTDGSGTITKKELKKGLKKLKTDCNSKILKAMIKDADTNGDGEIDFEEFKEIILQGGMG